MNIIIDPYMLELEDEREISNSISFFRVLYILSKAKRVRVFLYKDLVEKMRYREVKPFPIYIDKVQDSQLREKIKYINSLFVSVVMDNITLLDIESCYGEQNFTIESECTDVVNVLNSDSRYYELLCVVLQSCYNENLCLSQSIVKGNISKGLAINDAFYLKCHCTSKSFSREYRIEVIDKFASDEDKAYLELEQISFSHSIEFIASPEIVRGKHHNFLQNNSDFNTYEGLSRVNKSVISLLRRFGMRKVIFGEFHADSSHVQGSIVAYDVQITDDNDIVKGWLYAETGYKNHVDLYFPKAVGRNLKIYLKNEFEKNSVQRLIDSLL